MAYSVVCVAPRRNWKEVRHFSTRFLKQHCFMEGSKASPLCPGKSRLQIEMSMENWWNDTDRESPKCSRQNLSQCHFVHHKSRTEWPGIEPRPPRWEASD
jgi:hypothetical protein